MISDEQSKMGSNEKTRLLHMCMVCGKSINEDYQKCIDYLKSWCSGNSIDIEEFILNDEDAVEFLEGLPRIVGQLAEELNKPNMKLFGIVPTGEYARRNLRPYMKDECIIDNVRVLKSPGKDSQMTRILRIVWFIRNDNAIPSGKHGIMFRSVFILS